MTYYNKPATTLNWTGISGLTEYTKISRSRQKFLRKNKKVPFSKVGKKVFYNLSLIDQLFDNNSAGLLLSKKVMNLNDSCSPRENRKKLVDTKTLAALLEFSNSKMQNLRNDGIIPFYRIQGFIRYDLYEIDDWLFTHEVVSLEEVLYK